MSKQRVVNTSIWSDPWFVDTLSISERYLFIYLFTNEHTNIAGVYEMSLRTMGNETGYDKEELVRMLQKMRPKVHYADGWVVLRNTIKNQNYHSPKIKTGIDLVIERAPAELRQHIAWPEDWGTVNVEEDRQTRLLADDVNDFDGNNVRQNRSRVVAKNDELSQKNVVSSYNRPVVRTDNTPPLLQYGIHKVSHSNSNSNSNSKTTVARASSTSEPSQNGHAKAATAETTGSKKSENSYTEVDRLYDHLQPLLNDQFRKWYCGVFFKLGRERVLVLASQAKADSNDDPKKLFSKLLADAIGSKPPGETKSLGETWRETRAMKGGY